MALSTAPKSILESTVAAAKASHQVQIADALTDAETLERTAGELLCVPAQHLEAFRQLERALTLRFKAAQLAERALTASDPSSSDDATARDVATLQEGCQKAAESIIVRYNETAVRAFKRGDFDLASHLLSNAFRLADAADETTDAFFANTTLKHSVKATTLNNFGCLERRRGRLPVALQYMRHALEFASTQSPATLLNISAVQTQMGQIDEAIGSARRALGLLEEVGPQAGKGAFRTSPNDVLALRAVAHHNLAMALERRDLKASLQEYNTALSLAKSAGALQTANQVERGLARVLHLRGAAVEPTSPRKTNLDSVVAQPSPPLTPDEAAAHEFEVAVHREALDQFKSTHPVDVAYSAKKPVGAPPSLTNQRRVDPALDKAVRALEAEASSASASAGDKGRVKPAPPSTDAPHAGAPRPKPTAGPNSSLPAITLSKPADASGKAETKTQQTGSAAVSPATTTLPPIQSSPSSAALKGNTANVNNTTTTTVEGAPASGENNNSSSATAATTEDAAQKGKTTASSGKPVAQQQQQQGGKSSTAPSSSSVAYAPQPPSTSAGTAAGGGAGGLRSTRLAREEEETRKEEVVQMMHQRLVALLKIEDEVEHEYLAARKIQCLIRSFLSRRRLVAVRLRRKQGVREAVARERSAAQVIIRFFRALKKKRDEDRARRAKERAEERLRVNMSIIIQCAARKFFARRYVRRLKRQKQSADEAARVMQRAMSTFLADVKMKRMIATRKQATLLMLEQEKRRYAATRIQAVFRRHHREVLNLVMRGDLKAARDKGWHLSRNAAAKRIQKVVRGRQVRQRYKVVLRERAIVRKNREERLARLNATIALQSFFRGQAIRNQLKPLYRAHVKQRRLERAANRGACARTIQCMFRCFKARMELRARRAQRYQERAAERKAGVLQFSARQYQRGLALL